MINYQKQYLYRRIVKAKLYIDRHFSEEVDLNSIASQAYFSKFHFIRLFKSIYGHTPGNYLIQKRIEEAKKLLLDGHSVADTGRMIGMGSPTTFTNTFKKLTGIPPSVFRETEQQRQAAIAKSPMRFVPNCFAETHGWTKPQF